MHISSLKEELRVKDELIMRLELQAAQHDEKKNELIAHVTGMNKVAVRTAGEGLHSVPRNIGISDRIRRAEQADRAQAEPLTAQRKKEYEDRIASLIKPEIEIQDAIQEDTAG